MLPLFVLVAGGYAVGRLVCLSDETLVRIITDFFMPMLVFHSLYTADMELEAVGKLAAATALVLVGLLAVSALYAHLAKAEPRSFIPPVIFMNSGFLGIPLMKLWGGLPAVNLIVVYDQVQTLFIFTLGILIVTGGFSAHGARQMAKSPMLWTIVAGFLFHLLAIPVPELILETLQFGGAGTPALAAFTLGCSLSRTRISVTVHLAAGILFRVALGFVLGLGTALFLRMDEPARTVVIVASSLPSAVFGFVLPARYGVRPDHATPLVLATTVLGFVTIPTAFYLAQLLAG
ncbi:MAG: AEC family transporter [Spirochaetales bacterium]|nr:AEC family transporter [Spirochaetales bacterium]